MNSLLAFLAALLITVLTTPLTIKLAKRFDLLDDPQKRPHPAHVQQRVIPRAGGLPIFMGIFISILLFVPFDKHILGILIGLIMLLSVGLLDDYLKNFSPFPRLLLQFSAAAVAVASGIGISFITNPFGGVLRLDQLVIPINFLGEHTIVILADILAFFWIVWIMNCLNWAKGVDGQMPGISLVACLTIAFLSFESFQNGDFNQLAIANLALITAGASLGFLFFNWHPAKIIPGFSGSAVLGFMIAVLCILTSAKLATALLVLLIPAVDFFYTFFRRILNKKSPFYGDQKHLHHLLLKKGWSHQAISLFYISSCAILGLLATQLSSEGKFFVILGVGVVMVGIILLLHHLVKNEQEE